MWKQITQIVDREFLQCTLQGLGAIGLPGICIRFVFIFSGQHVHANAHYHRERTVQQAEYQYSQMKALNL